MIWRKLYYAKVLTFAIFFATNTNSKKTFELNFQFVNSFNLVLKLTNVFLTFFN